MHVVGARFANLESANAALAAIRASVAIPLADVAVRPLGSTRYEEPASGFLLAGRFPAIEVDRVLGIVESHGGMVLSRRIERAHPGPAGGSGMLALNAARDQRNRAVERHGSQASRGETIPAQLRGAHHRLRRQGALLRVRAARSRGFSV
jgi:hypothetical protein